MIQVTQLLTIQKFIYLLDDFHFAEFEAYLTQIKAALPLKLIQIIRKRLPGFDDPETLCTKIYGDYTQSHRLSFNQLASYTFRLSSCLAINYPSYLTPNYVLLQQRVNAGDVEAAGVLANILLEISEKVEDYASQGFVLKFLIQEAFLMKQGNIGVKLSKQLTEVVEIEKAILDIFAALRLHLNMALQPKVTAEKLEEYKNFFKSYHRHTSASLRMLSKYAYIYAVYYHEASKFNDAYMRKLINDVDHELNNYDYVVFPFAFDIKSNFSFYKLQSSLFVLNSKQGKKELEELEKHYKSVKFWNSYLNIPGIFTLALQASDYLTTYHHSVHRSDYYKIIPANDLKDIHILAQQCGEMLKHKGLEKYYKNDLINLHLLHSGLMILSGGDGIRKGAEELESMLISYQQVNLAGTTDSIFLFLMIAYFSLRDYNGCAKTFKRYVRSTKDKTVFDENDKEIKSYYFLSQWLLFRRNQYLDKLKAIYIEMGDSTQAKAIRELLDYFNVPLKV